MNPKTDNLRARDLVSIVLQIYYKNRRQEKHSVREK